ncbi:MAG: hypothetical protein CL897_02025 [Dehalococcoidia bacterium]|nr:hypothetical protein [Dehalococcoidia bacterium]HCU99785.1 hypothetical protein [Dehalococcoidia bacterium]|tara:strand:+ start:5200 stop:5709 length:510 start_codon:yes stop_codon:yes gene_type:complete
MLAEHTCQEEHLPKGYELLTFGNLSRSELGREVEDAKLAAAGVDRGYFTFWKERLDGLQDDQAVEVVCQVLVFENPVDASRFVTNLPAETSWLSVTVAGIPLSEGKSIPEVDLPDAKGTRGFRVEENEGRIRYAVITARKQFVLSVHLEGSENAASLSSALAILEELAR